MTEKEMCEKFGVPSPENSPEDRMRDLMAWRNEWKLYRRKCDQSGQEIISAYAPDSPFKVYKNDIWWGDSWDATTYGRDYDFSRPFFDQFADLQKVVPREGTSIFNSENCDFNGHVRTSRNCYLSSLVVDCENAMYSYFLNKNTDIMDCNYMINSTLCYECNQMENGYNVVMSEESQNISDAYFCYQLRGCDHCMFSNNLANKSYYLYNKPCTKEEFEEAKKKYINGSYTAWKSGLAEYERIKSTAIRRATTKINCENSTGDHLFNSRNCIDSYEGKESEDVQFAVSFHQSKNIYSAYSAGWPACELVYYSAVSRGSMRLKFCYYTFYSNDLTYCDSSSNSENCFGSIGMRHKKYCILNKQYSKEEYEALIPKIIDHMKSTGEWGKFFPHSLSPFAYNETSANDFMSLSEAEATSQGWRWREKEHAEYKPASIAELPDDINQVSETITKELLACETCGKNYRIIPQELTFYKNISLPLPHFCPTCRNAKRIASNNPRSLRDDICSNCKSPIQTTYPTNHSETVYCDSCYLEEIN